MWSHQHSRNPLGFDFFFFFILKNNENCSESKWSYLEDGVALNSCVCMITAAKNKFVTSGMF